MLTRIFKTGGHYLVILAGIGAAPGLMASGHMDSQAGATLISGLSFGGAGLGIATKAASSTTTTGS